MKRLAFLSVIGTLFVVGQAIADTPIRERAHKHIGKKHCGRYDKLHDWATQSFGKKTVGRDICRYGMPKPGPGDRLPTKAEYTETMEVLDRWRHPPTPEVTYESSSATTGSSYSSSSVESGGYAAGGVAGCGAACVQCESGGNPQAVSPDGQYWGLYQFSYNTWVGAGGDPSAYGNADAGYQTEIASQLEGDHWPNC
jgi:hypothetical protein